MASWESRSWPVRRWLADHLVGDHAYSKNVAQPPLDVVEFAQRMATYNATTVRYTDAYGDEWLVPRPPSDLPLKGPVVKRWFESLPSSSRIPARNPGETA